MDWQRIGFVAACLIVPPLWGAGWAFIFARIDRKKAQSRQPNTRIDYMI